MTTWQEGVKAIERGHASDAPEKHQRFPWVSRTPIVILGGPGAGKTEIWRRLTGGSAQDAMSTDIDQGYFFGRSRRRSVAITTVPGQTSDHRYLDLERYFGSTTKVSGVIFVASFGFDHIWPSESDLTAAELPALNVKELSDRNIRRELEAFQETCNLIRKKHTITRNPEQKPKWLLVLANKVDLYWDAREKAGDYYVPGCKSEFDLTAQQLQDDVGRLANLQYEVLPMTLSPMQYEFGSNRGRFVVDTQLDRRHAEASLDLLVNAMERLNGL